MSDVVTKGGRFLVSNGNRIVWVKLRVTRDERCWLQLQSEMSGLTIAAYLRRVLRAEYERTGL